MSHVEWKKVRLGDVCIVLNGRAYSQPELLNSGKYKVLRVGNLVGGDKFYYSDMELEENKYCFDGDLLYAWACSFDSYIWKEGKTIFHYHIWKLLPKEDVLDKKFFYFYLKYVTPRLLGKTNGSVMQHITKDLFEKTELSLPPLEEQKRIAGILNSLDDKIELNNKINDNLEKQAQALFKNWFIDGKEKNGVVGDYCDVKSGFAFKSSWWRDTGTKVIRIGDIEQDCLNLDCCIRVPNDKIEIAKNFTVRGGDLVIAMTGATIGKFAMVPMVDNTILVNQRVGKFFLGDNPLNRVPFIYCTFKQDDVLTEFINRGQGSAQPNISAGDILSIPCWIPEKGEIENFNQMAMPLFESIVDIQSENQRLTTLRDTLLPKLMSGAV